MLTKLEKRYRLAKKLLADRAIDEYIKAGLINERDIRNCRIIDDYVRLRKQYNHLDSLDQLAEKYFLSTERLTYIIYQKHGPC